MFKKASREDRMLKAREIDPPIYDRLIAAAIIGPGHLCWPMQTALNKDGYAHLKVRGRRVGAHRLMFAIFFPGVAAPVVRHMCNNPYCINPAHLRGGTQHDNVMDRVNCNRGGDLRGERNGRAKLLPADIEYIRNSPDTGSALALELGVSKVLVCRIRRGTAWKHIPSNNEAQPWQP
jgi:hypothetical protein